MLTLFFLAASSVGFFLLLILRMVLRVIGRTTEKPVMPSTRCTTQAFANVVITITGYKRLHLSDATATVAEGWPASFAGNLALE